jgi:endonuclease III
VRFPRPGTDTLPEPAWAAAAVLGEGRPVAESSVAGEVRAQYAPGLLALREGPLLEVAVRRLAVQPDVLLVDATGRDHPRRAGLALHLGAVLDLPTAGATHRPLLARGEWPEDCRGAATPLELDGERMGAWVRTRRGVPAHRSPRRRADHDRRRRPDRARSQRPASHPGAAAPRPPPRARGADAPRGYAVSMAPTQRDIARALLDRYGRTFAEELGIDVAKNTPSPLFRLLCAAALMSARISSSIAVEAARNLAKRGWRTPQKLADSTWQQRVQALNAAGYTRYQERTATMLGELAEHLLERWGGDLRRLREEAGRYPKAERKLLEEFKGVGEVGVDIFFREVQAARLNLPRDPAKLADLVGRSDYPRLAAALVRVELDDDYDAVRKAA